MYKIFADDMLIYDSTVDEYKLAKGSITLETNKSGLFSFSIYPDHFYYDNFIKLKTIITVYKRGKIVFRGRILNDVTDYWNNKVITCEGELGFLQDSIIRPFDFSGTPDELFRKFILEHNSQVDEFKRFKIGKVTVFDPNNYIARSNSAYESSLSNLNSRLIGDSLGGYFYITHGVDGTEITPTINYLDDFTKVSSQPIEFGVNLKTFTKNVKAESLCTAVIPLGKEIDDGDDKTDNKRLTIASVNDGKDFIYSEEAVAIYGWIYRTVTFDDVTDASNLKTKGEKYLSDNAKQHITIELTAIDLHLLNPEIESINVCEYVRALSKPHNFDVVMLCNKQTMDILNPNNDSYVLGYTYSTLTTSTAEIKKNMGTISSNYVTNQRFTNALTNTSTLIEQTEKNVLIQVDAHLTDLSESVSAKLNLKVGTDENDKIISMINASANVITLNSNRLKINSDKFTLTEDGSITATDALLKSTSGDYSVKIKDGTITVDGPWKALGEGVVQEMLVLQFHSAFGDLCGLYIEGTLDDDLSFSPSRIYVKKIEG
jgi:phage minor structural protein